MHAQHIRLRYDNLSSYECGAGVHTYMNSSYHARAHVLGNMLGCGMVGNKPWRFCFVPFRMFWPFSFYFSIDLNLSLSAQPLNVFLPT